MIQFEQIFANQKKLEVKSNLDTNCSSNFFQENKSFMLRLYFKEHPTVSAKCNL